MKFVLLILILMPSDKVLKHWLEVQSCKDAQQIVELYEARKLTVLSVMCLSEFQGEGNVVDVSPWKDPANSQTQ